MSLPTFAPCQQYGAYVVLRTARWMWIGPFRSNYATEGYQNVFRVVRRLLVTFFLLVTCISTFWWLVCWSQHFEVTWMAWAPGAQCSRDFLLFGFSRLHLSCAEIEVRHIFCCYFLRGDVVHCTNRCTRIRREPREPPTAQIAAVG